MKRNILATPKNSFITAVAAFGVALSGAVSQAQPSITQLALPNAPNYGQGFNVGDVQYQGAVPPSANQLTFSVGSGTGITALSVQLVGTSLPGVKSTNVLTAGSGLSVSGGNTSESATANLNADTVYTALITATDSGGTSYATASFDTLNPNYFTFEAEDFDFGGGQFYDSLPAGTFPELDAYLNDAATVGIDCNNHSGGQASYRPNPLETEGIGSPEVPRIQYASSGYPDFDVGFNNGGDWGNYTRTYPAGLYNIYLRGSGGNGPQANACSIGLVTSGWGTTSQTTKTMGNFSVLGLGWQDYTWCPAIDGNGNEVAWAAGGDQETLRFTVINGNCNENFYMLVPAAPAISPATPNVYQGNSCTLSIYPQALNSPSIVWQTDNGTGGATWTTINGATSSTYNVPAGSLQLKTYQYQAVVTFSDNGNPVSVTSAPVALNILAATKPVITQNTTPSAATNIVGTVSTFTASFAGNTPITFQWEVSSNGGSSFSNIGGQTANVLLVTNTTTSTNILYELVASNSIGTTASTPASLTITPAPPRPPLQLAGDLIVNLQESDLSPTMTVWSNRTGASASVGNFEAQGGGDINIATNAPAWDTEPVLALNVNGNASDAIESTLESPTEIVGNLPVSVEVWAYADSVQVGGNNTVLGYGNQGGSGAQYEDREFDYNNNGSGNSAFSGNFGGDFNWNTTPTAGVWHYLAWTFDGTNVIAYVDGNADRTNSGQTMHTVQSYIVVGGGIANGGPNVADQFDGYIAAARVSSGVLTASEVSNNFAAGLTASVPVEVYEPTASPTNTMVTPGSSLTLSADDSGAEYTFTYQWLTDNGTGGQTWTAIQGATSSTYLVNTTGLAIGYYEYEVELINSAHSITAVSSPIIIQVTAATPPEIVQNTTPASVTMYVTQTATLSASFSGEAPLDLQWQISADGSNFSNIDGANGTNLVVTSDEPSTNYYRLHASNPLGTNVTTAAEVAILPAAPLPPVSILQTAGDVIVNLQASDLVNGRSQWINATINPNNVGTFTPRSGSTLNLSTNAPYLYHRVNALLVNQSIANAVQSAQTAPAEISQNNPCSVEAWIYATALNEQNSCVVGYGMQGQSEAPEEDREFNYEAGFGGGSTSGDFGSFDSAWSTPPTTNTWHYLAWTWDGTTVTCYADGAYDHSQTPSTPLITAPTVIGVGGSLGQEGSGANITVDAFQGYIGAARVESGVLNSDQVTSNYDAGLFGIVPLTIYPQPLQYTYSNGSLSITWGYSGTLQQASKLTGPWSTVTSTSPYVTTPASGGQSVFYRVKY